MKFRYLNALFPFLLLLVSACGSDEGVDGEDDDDSRDNSANVEVSGALDGSYSGTATFVTVLGISHSVTIALDENKGTVTMSTVGLADEGSYGIADGSDPQSWAVVATLTDLGSGEGTFGSVVLTEGSVTITRLDDNRIEGRFDGSGETNTSQTLNMEGDFEASCFDITGTIC